MNRAFGILLCGAVSAGAHVALAVVFLGSVQEGDVSGGGVGGASVITVPPQAGVATLVETWEAQPEVGAVEDRAADPAADAAPSRPVADNAPTGTEAGRMNQPKSVDAVPVRIPDAVAPGSQPVAAAPEMAVLPDATEAPPKTRSADAPERGDPSRIRDVTRADDPPVADMRAPERLAPRVADSPRPQVRPSREVRTATAAPASVASGSRASGGSGRSTAKAVAADTSALRQTWAGQIRSAIARRHSVPQAAAQNGLSGRTVVRIQVDPDGRLAGMGLRQSSGHTVLDRAALVTVRRARLPRAPSGVTAAVTVDVPLSFQVR